MEYEIDGKMIDGKYLTNELKHDDRFVNRAARAFAKLQKALKEFNEFRMEKIVPEFIKRTSERDIDKEKEEKSGKGVTIYNVGRTRRVVIKQALRIKMGEAGNRAKEIIDAKIREWEGDLPGDVADLFGLLKGMFLERRKMMFSPAIAAFVGMQNIKDKDLQKAQGLLRTALISDVGKVWVTVEWKQADGGWQKAS